MASRTQQRREQRGTGKGRRGKGRPWLRRLLVVALVLAVVPLALFAAALLWLNSTAGLRFVADQGLGAANKALRGSVEVDDAEGHLLSEFTLRGVRLLGPDGAEIVVVETLEMTWRPWELVQHRAVVDRMALHGVRGDLAGGPDGLNLVLALPAPAGEDRPPTELPVDIIVRQIVLDGAVTFDPDGPGGEAEPYRVDAIDLAGSTEISGRRIDVDVERLALDAANPALGALELSTSVTLAAGSLDRVELELRGLAELLTVEGSVGPLSDLDLDLRLALTALDLDTLDILVPNLPLTGVVDLELAVRGGLEDLSATGKLGLPTGSMGLDLWIDTTAAPLAYRATLDPVGVDLSTVLTAAKLPSSLTGRIDVDGQGTSVDTLRGTVDLDLDDSALRDIAVDDLQLQARLEPPLRVTVDHLVTAGPLGRADLHGDVAIRDATYTAEGSVVGVDLAAVAALGIRVDMRGVVSADLDQVRGGWGRSSGVWVEAAGAARGSAIRASGVTVGAVTATFDAGWSATSGATGRVGARASSIVAGVAIERVDVTADLRGTAAHVDTQVTLDAKVATRVVADLDWSGASGSTLDVSAESWSVVAHGTAWQSTGPFHVALRERGAVEITGLELSGVNGQLRLEGTLALKGSSSLKANLDGLRLASIQPLLPAKAPTLKGTVGFDLTLNGEASMPIISLQLRAEQLQVDQIGPLQLQVGLVVAGGMTTVVASVGAEGLQPLQLQGVLPFVVDLDQPGYRGDQMVQLFVEIPLQRTANLAAIWPDAAKLPPSRFGLKVTTAGTGSNPTVQARVWVRDVEYADLPSIDADVDGIVERGSVNVEGRIRDVRQELATANLTGALQLGRMLDETLDPAVEHVEGPYLGGFAARVELVGVPVETTRLFTDVLKPLHGKIVGSVVLQGDPKDPDLDARLSLRGGRLGEVSLKTVEIDAQVTGGQLESSVQVEARDAGMLDGKVRSPLNLGLVGGLTVQQRFGQPGLEGELRAEGLPLGMVTAFVPDSHHALGTMSLTGRVSGSLLKPDPDLELRIADGAVCVDGLGVCYDEIELRAASSLTLIELQQFRMRSNAAPDYLSALERADTKSGRKATARADARADAAEKRAAARAEVAEKRAAANGASTGKRGARGAKNQVVGGGYLEASGSLALNEGGLGDANLDVQAQDFTAMYTRQVKMATDLSLSVRGKYPDLRVRGSVTVGKLKVELGDELRKSAWPMDPDPTLVIHRGHGGETEEVVERKRLEIVDRMDLDIDVVIERNCWVYLDVSAVPGLGRIRPDIQIEGELGLRMNRGVFLSEGEIRTVRGNLTLLARQFEVDSGTVTFTGATPPDPALNIQATHHSRYGDIVVIVDGRASAPQLRFSSDTLQDEDDIFAVLLFGVPLDELRAGQSSAGTDELAMLTGMVGAQASGFINRLVGKSAVDMVNLEPNPSGPGSFGIEVGKTLTDRLFLVTRYRFGVDSDENSFDGQLEIMLTRTLFIEIGYGDAGNGGLEVILKRRLHDAAATRKE